MQRTGNMPAATPCFACPTPRAGRGARGSGRSSGSCTDRLRAPARWRFWYAPLSYAAQHVADGSGRVVAESGIREIRLDANPAQQKWIGIPAVETQFGGHRRVESAFAHHGERTIVPIAVRIAEMAYRTIQQLFEALPAALD